MSKLIQWDTSPHFNPCDIDYDNSIMDYILLAKKYGSEYNKECEQCEKYLELKCGGSFKVCTVDKSTLNKEYKYSWF